jgi:hypothetical protein
MFSQHFGGLAGAAKVGAENGVDGIAQADFLSSQPSFLKTFSVQGDIEPATESFVPTGHIQAGVAVPNDEQISHNSFLSPAALGELHPKSFKGRHLPAVLSNNQNHRQRGGGKLCGAMPSEGGR